MERIDFGQAKGSKKRIYSIKKIEERPYRTDTFLQDIPKENQRKSALR